MSARLREEIIRLIESDREFRYALMGLLGFREILDRITRIEERQLRLEEAFRELAERQQRLEERQLRLEERFAQLEERFAKLEEAFRELMERQQKLEERQQKLEERFAKLEERFAQLEERVIKLEERFAQLEERFAKLEERVIRLEERMARVEEELKETRRVLSAISHRFGILSEHGFREAMKYVIEEALGVAKVERKTLRDDEGIVYGHPAIIEIDVVVRDKEHILVEIKSRVSRGDVAELHRIGKLYEKVVGIKPRLVIVGGFIDPSAWESAARLGVEIRPAFRESFEV